jgi:3-phosphoshikimate 1-carboxyvinyltransferase
MKAILSINENHHIASKIAITGSKSESNRLLILKAQFPNISIKNLSDSDDTQVLQKALKSRAKTVDIHHAGTAMRFLTAYFAAKEGAEVVLTGSDRMQQRPIGVLVDALRDLGADIQYEKKEGFPPLKIIGKTLQKSEVNIPANISSQYISALMLIGPVLPNGLKIHLKGKITSRPYIEMTLLLMKKVGVKGSFSSNKIIIPAINKVEKKTITVESDWSSASYFYSLVALSDTMKITLKSFSKESLQGDSALVSIYGALGVETTFDASKNAISLLKNETELSDSLMLDLSGTPDLAQTIAVTCFGLGIGCNLSGLHTLKIKETDRLVALKTELEKLGAEIKIDKNSLLLEIPEKINPGIAIDTYQDHRMAMAFAPLAVKTKLTINDSEVVSKSYPSFWHDIKKVGIDCVLKNSK